MRSEVKRAVGPEMESAAMASPESPMTGAAIAVSPTSSSSIDVAYPRARTLRSSGVSFFGAAEGEKALPVGGELELDLAADPVGDADEVSGVLLRQVLDPVRVPGRQG